MKRFSLLFIHFRRRFYSLYQKSVVASRNLSGRKKLLILGGVGAVIVAGFALHASYLNQVVVVINDKKITRAELQPYRESRKSFLEWQKRVQPIQPPPSEKSLEEQAVDEAIYASLIDHYSQKNAIAISDTVLQKRYTKAYQSLGSEQEYLDKIYEIYHIDKAGILLKIKRELLEDRLEEKMHVRQEDLPEYLKKQAKVTISL